MLRRVETNKARFMKIVSQVMEIVIAVATILTVSPGASHAAVVQPPITSAMALVSNNNTTVTVTFNTYATPATNLEDLKSNIKMERSGANSFVDLAADNANNQINMTAEGALVIVLGAALTGTANAITVKAGSVMNSDSISSAADVVVSNIAALDITPPVNIGSSVNNNGGTVFLNFDEDISIPAAEAEQTAFLRSKISVATDGVHFAPLFERSEASEYDSRKIYLRYYDDIKIILGANTIIKIAAGTVQDAAGNFNQEMTVHVSPPVIQSAAASNYNHDVTIAFKSVNLWG